MNSRTAIIIVAGGSGRRMGGELPKQFRLLGEAPILVQTINRMHRAIPAAQLIVVLPESHIDFWRNLSARFEVARHTVVPGGTERFYSVRQGLSAVALDCQVVAIHDAVRPLATETLIRRTIGEAAELGSAIPVIEAVDSYRIIEGNSSRIADRTHLRIVQTPQAFQRALLDEAYNRPFEPRFTDDASVVEALGEPIHLIEGERSNLKITTADDLTIANALFTAEAEKTEHTSL